ncbi:MAG: hypothetical protein AAF531_19755 [Actinomycetota bacterium]
MLWPAAILFHLAANGHHLVPLDRIGGLQLLLAAAAVGAIVRPRPWLSAALGATYLLVFWLKLPVVGNHEVLLALVALAVVIAVPHAARRGTWWVPVAAPAIRSALLIGYGSIAISKLNTGFFDLAVSCAVVFADELLGPFGPGGGPVGLPAWSAVWLTAGIELVIPVLLVVGRTRRLGLAVALTFHLVLALDPVSHIWDFSATLLPMFLLFGSTELRRTLDRAADRIRGVPKRELTLLLVTLCSVQGLFLLLTAVRGAEPDGSSVLWSLVGPWFPAYPVWLVVGGGTLALACRAVRRPSAPGRSPFGDEPVGGTDVQRGADPGRDGAERGNRPGREHRLRPAAPLLIVVGLAMLNGLGPYLEYRSAAAFNMYANLAVVDGRSNHLIVPAVRSADGEPSVVRLHAAAPDSALVHYLEADLLLPAENLDRYLREHADQDPLVSRPGGPIRSARSLGFGGDTQGGMVADVTDTLRHKLGFRRAVDGTGAHRCQRAWGPIG